MLCNVLAMSQMLAMALLVTAFWGLGSNEEEIIKVGEIVLLKAVIIQVTTAKSVSQSC